MADILIRGMDMVNIKTGCPFRADDGYGGSDCVAGSDYCTAPFANRGADCPVAVLPEGHGRLKDSRYIIDTIKETYCSACVCSPTSFNCQLCKITKVIEIIENAPTIVPAEGGTGDD